MVPRLYVPLLGASDRTIDLPDDEAGHLRRVLRVKAGAAIRLFDGRGREVAARVAAVLPDRVVAEIGDAVDAAPEWGVRVTLAQAVLKGDKIDEVIRDAVMMGVSAVQLLVTARTEVPAPAWSRGRRLERWQRIAVSSAKQCGRAVVPAVLAPAPLGDVLRRLSRAGEADAGGAVGGACRVRNPRCQPRLPLRLSCWSALKADGRPTRSRWRWLQGASPCRLARARSAQTPRRWLRSA